MKKSLILTSGVLAVLALPLIAAAQAGPPITSLGGLGTVIIGIINNVLVPVLFAVAFIVFLWGAFDVFILGANDEGKKGQGKNLMLWGLIGFFVMVSVWGLVNILLGTFNFPGTGIANPPQTGVPIRP